MVWLRCQYRTLLNLCIDFSLLKIIRSFLVNFQVPYKIGWVFIIARQPKSSIEYLWIYYFFLVNCYFYNNYFFYLIVSILLSLKYYFVYRNSYNNYFFNNLCIFPYTLLINLILPPNLFYIQLIKYQLIYIIYIFC